ncbi:hypothetical protein PMAYCL1PPCAC_17851, partial [Pristionchus mayeri]
ISTASRINQICVFEVDQYPVLVEDVNYDEDPFCAAVAKWITGVQEDSVMIRREISNFIAIRTEEYAAICSDIDDENDAIVLSKIANIVIFVFDTASERWTKYDASESSSNSIFLLNDHTCLRPVTVMEDIPVDQSAIVNDHPYAENRRSISDGIVREHPGGDQQEVVLLRDLDSIVRKRNCAICKSPLSKEELIVRKKISQNNRLFHSTCASSGDPTLSWGRLYVLEKTYAKLSSDDIKLIESLFY